MAQEPEKYLLLATNRTGTMQDELNEAGARGYRFAGTQGGETAFGGREAVVIMALDPEGRRFRYILLATNRTGTMQREMNEAPPEYNFAGMTVFSSTFGGRVAAVILKAEITEDWPPRTFCAGRSHGASVLPLRTSPAGSEAQPS